MGYYVAMNFSFPSNNSEKALKNLQAAAKAVKGKTTGKYTEYMIDDIIKDPNQYVQGGNKGDLFHWGSVWNYYSAENELDDLKMFMLELYKYPFNNDPDEPIELFERAMLLVNPEQSENTQIYQLGLKENGDMDYLPEVAVKQTDIDLNWGQY